jgi:hypothetical protein
LVAVDATIDPAGWSDPAAWRPSFDSGGSPGAVDRLRSDVDQNGAVDLVDLAILQSFLGTGSVPASGDPTGDGEVDRADFAVLLRNLGRTYSLDLLNDFSGSPPAAASLAATDQVLADDVQPIPRRVHEAPRLRRSVSRANRSMGDINDTTSAQHTWSQSPVTQRALHRVSRRSSSTFVAPPAQNLDRGVDLVFAPPRAKTKSA